MMTEMRTIIEVPDDVVASLDRMSSREKRSRAAIIREAIAEYLQRTSLPPAEAAFGLWKREPTDGVRYQNDLRADWESR